jgi:hypothetical protein
VFGHAVDQAVSHQLPIMAALVRAQARFSPSITLPPSSNPAVCYRSATYIFVML